MSEIVLAETPQTPARRGKWLALALLVAALTGFGASYSGTLLPSSLLSRNSALPIATYTDVPRLSIPMGNARVLILAVKLETRAESQALAESEMPRILDSFNRFLTNIDPAAFHRRGVLEIIRQELLTRAQHIAGSDAIIDLLVTEFTIQ